MLKHNTIYYFPDTDSEYVDVGIGAGIKVAEEPVNTLVKAVKKGRGFVLEIQNGDYSEVFMSRTTISIKEFKDYFGSLDALTEVPDLEVVEE